MNRIIPIDIYRTDLLLVVGTRKELKTSLEGLLSGKEAKEAYNLMAEGMDGTCRGRSALLDNGGVVLWMPDASDKGTMAHEIFHVVRFVMERVGIGLCDESDEAYAYLIGYVTDMVNDAVSPSSDGSPSR